MISSKIRLLDSLTDKKPYLATPIGDALEGDYGKGFYEIRVKTGEMHRFIYRPYGAALVVFHGFKKEGGPVPETEKLVASNRYNDLKDRLGTEPDPLGIPVG